MNEYLEPGSARVVMAVGEDSLQAQQSVDRLQRVDWIESLVAPDGWEVMATFTFRWEASLESARRCYERFIQQRLPRISYFYSIEPNPSRDGHHVHALWADCLTVNRKAIWQEVVGTSARPGRWGFARIEPVRSKADSSEYASKYLCKADAWYNVKLQWHRMQKLHRSEFKLGSEQPARSLQPWGAPRNFPCART
jgi:hypothetical protein